MTCQCAAARKTYLICWGEQMRGLEVKVVLDARNKELAYLFPREESTHSATIRRLKERGCRQPFRIVKKKI